MFAGSRDCPGARHRDPPGLGHRPQEAADGAGALGAKANSSGGGEEPLWPTRGSSTPPPSSARPHGGLGVPALLSLCRGHPGPARTVPLQAPGPAPTSLSRPSDPSEGRRLWFLAHCPLPWMDGHKGDTKLGAPRAGPASVNAARPVATDGPAGRPLGAEPSWPLRGAAVCYSLGRGRSCWAPRAEGREDQEPPQGPGLPPPGSGAVCLSVWQEHRGGATTCRSSGLFLGGPLFLPSRPPFSRDLLRPSGGAGHLRA